jgi:hypothetical protein
MAMVRSTVISWQQTSYRSAVDQLYPVSSSSVCEFRVTKGRYCASLHDAAAAPYLTVLWQARSGYTSPAFTARLPSSQHSAGWCEGDGQPAMALLLLLLLPLLLVLLLLLLPV